MTKMLLIHMDKTLEVIETEDAKAYILGKFDWAWDYECKFDNQFVVQCEEGEFTSEHKYNPLASSLLNRYILGDAVITKLDSDYNIISMEDHEIERFKRIIEGLVLVDEAEWERR